MSIKTICFICEKDIEIPDREIKIASQHRIETGGKVLVACSQCWRVMVLPEPVPEGMADLEAWIAEAEEEGEDWCGCPPLLEKEVAVEPSGVVDYHGKKLYRPGNGGTPLMKRPYMYKYGVDPEGLLNAMRKTK